jgi:hypothetical protein
VLDARLPSGTTVGDSILDSPKAVLALPQPVRQALQDAVASSVAVVFQWALPVIVVAFLVSLLLREIPLREDVNVAAAAIEGMEEASFGVLGEPGPRGMDEAHDDWRAPSSASAAQLPTDLE